MIFFRFFDFCYFLQNGKPKYSKTNKKHNKQRGFPLCLLTKKSQSPFDIGRVQDLVCLMAVGLTEEFLIQHLDRQIVL